jgi:hypothetical protein
MGIYHPWFTITVEHDYFADGQWQGLYFEPDDRTSLIIRSAGMIIRESPSALAAFRTEESLRVLRLETDPPDGMVRLNFSVRARDRRFGTYTALPPARDGALLHFEAAARAGDHDGTITLSKGPLVSEADLCATAAPTGRGIFGNHAHRLPPDFTFTLALDPATPAAAPPAEFELRFGARRSFWKYHLLGNLNRREAFIVDLDNQVEFEPCGDTLLPGDRPARVFRSRQRIPLQERSDYRFQLRETAPGGPRVLVKRLPVASDARLGLDLIDGRNEVVLETFVNC